MMFFVYTLLLLTVHCCIAIGLPEKLPRTELLSRSPPSTNASDSSTSLSLGSQGLTEWYLVIGNGTKITRITDPHANDVGGNDPHHQYRYGIGRYRGPIQYQPALQKFLVECMFGLFGQVPDSPPGVWTPYRAGQYGCENGQAVGQLGVNLVGNTIDYQMAFHDLAFVLKLLADTEGVKAQSRYFEFAISYTPDARSVDFKPVISGGWVGPATSMTSK